MIPTTIKGWLEDLPEPYRTQALENLWEEHAETPATSIGDALVGAFLFAQTKQGLVYWWDVVVELSDEG